MQLERLLLGIAALLLACSSPEERAEQARADARQALSRGERSAALEAIEVLRASQVDTPEALLETVSLLVGAGEAPQAVWLLEEGVARFPEADRLELALGRVALLVNDPGRARAAAERIGPDSEAHPQALVLRAQAQIELGDLEAGLATLTRAETLYPEQAGLRLPRVTALWQEQRYAEAREALLEARASTRDAADLASLRRLQIALYGAQAREGEVEEAIAGVRTLVDEVPEDVAGWSALVQLLALAGRPQEGRDLLLAAIAEDPERYGLYPTLSAIHARLGEEEEAERVWLELLERQPSPSVYLTLATFLTARERAEEALARLDDALARYAGEPMLLAARAETLIDLDRTQAARSAVAALREAAPWDPTGEFLTARVELAEGDASAAVARLSKLIPEYDNAGSQFWFGRALEATGDLPGAERRYLNALMRGPAETAPSLALIRIGEARGDWPQVAGAAQVLVTRAPGVPEGWDAFTMALVELAELEGAEDLARRAVLLFPDRARSRLMLAHVLRAQGRSADALAELAAASDQAGELPEITAERALILAESGRSQEAITSIHRALENHDDSAELHFALAQLHFLRGEVEMGAKETDRALSLDPGNPAPLEKRAEFYAATGRLEPAHRDCLAYLEQRPNDASVHFILGATHDGAGRKDEAIAAYRRSAELDENAVAARNNLAELLAERGDLDAALEAAQQAYRLADDNPYVMDTLGYLYLRKGFVDRSISVLEDAREADPEMPEAQLHLALAYREAGRRDNARELLSDLRPRTADRSDLRAQVDDALASL
jgi:tetratricopeptide (TPR) repeat protein